ncbi:hypothetical protein ACF0H5_000589 [Mactra antiquata]
MSILVVLFLHVCSSLAMEVKWNVQKSFSQVLPTIDFNEHQCEIYRDLHFIEITWVNHLELLGNFKRRYTLDIIRRQSSSNMDSKVNVNFIACGFCGNIA